VSNESTKLMRRGMGLAVTELRRRQKWDQTQLGKQIHRFGLLARLPVPTRLTVSRWENGTQIPSIANRTALGKIAKANDHECLYEAFTAPDSSWRFVAALIDARIVFLAGDEAGVERANAGQDWQDSQ